MTMPPRRGEKIIEDEDSWLDDISLYVGFASTQDSTFNSQELSRITPGYFHKELPSYTFSATMKLDEGLREIFKFLTTLEHQLAVMSKNKDTSSRKPLGTLPGMKRCGRREKINFHFLSYLITLEDLQYSPKLMRG